MKPTRSLTKWMSRIMAVWAVMSSEVQVSPPSRDVASAAGVPTRPPARTVTR